MSAKVKRLETRIERLWREYVEARARAIDSTDIRDGIKAGRAYAAFVHEFLKPEDRKSMESAREHSSSRRAL